MPIHESSYNGLTKPSTARKKWEGIVLWWVDREALGETVESGFRTGVELLGARRACLYLRGSEEDSMVTVASLNHDPLE
jgi:hypothetical protein